MTAKAVEQSLIRQLEARGADIEAFRALIADYMEMYKVCGQLKKDVHKRGAVVDSIGSTGQNVTKCNPSIRELRDTNRAMLAILKQLGLTMDNVSGGEEDEL